MLAPIRPVPSRNIEAGSGMAVRSSVSSLIGEVRSSVPAKVNESVMEVVVVRALSNQMRLPSVPVAPAL